MYSTVFSANFLHTFIFFLFIQPQLLLHFFYLLVFLLPFVYCCAFILFPYFYPCIFSKHFYTFYVSYVSYFFLCFVNKNTRYTILYTEQKKLSVFSFEKKKEKNFPKNHIMISNCCVIFTRSSTCVYRHIKNNKERSILSVKSNAVTLSFRIPQNLINLDFLACSRNENPSNNPNNFQQNLHLLIVNCDSWYLSLIL